MCRTATLMGPEHADKPRGPPEQQDVGNTDLGISHFILYLPGWNWRDVSQTQIKNAIKITITNSVCCVET